MWSFMTSSGFMFFSGGIALIAGGVLLIVAGMPMQAEELTRRVKLVMPRTPAPTAPVAVEGAPPIVGRLGASAAGLTAAEQRQIIWLFSKLGVSANLAVGYFVALRLIAAIALAVLIVMASGQLAAFAASWTLRLAVGVAGAIVGWVAPILYVSRGAKKRMQAVASGLPDALELLVVCVEAGLSLEDGLQRVTRELRDSQPALAEELALTWAEINILPSRAQALSNLAHRVEAPAVRSVVSVLTQSLQFGTPLAQSLRVGATEMRNDQMTQLEERASRLPALMTIPVMLFIMPTIFLLIGGPAGLRVFDMLRRSFY